MNVPTRRRRRTRGFTLPEVLVVLAIVAIMAAVLMPVLVNQLRRGDVSRVVSDLATVRTGMEAFMADVRRVPGELSHLTTPITGSDEDVLGNTYPSGLVSRWRGPYLDRQPVDNAFPTGFGGLIQMAVDTIISDGISYAIVDVEGLTQSEFDDIDFEIDAEVSSSTGRFRFDGTTASFLVFPVN